MKQKKPSNIRSNSEKPQETAMKMAVRSYASRYQPLKKRLISAVFGVKKTPKKGA